MARPLLDGVDELLDWKHFVSRATGDDLEGEGIRPGVFRGRRRELRRVANVLDASSARPCLVLVTGSPGAGKSALLGLTVCAAHSVLSDVTDALWREHRDHHLPAVHSSLAMVDRRPQALSRDRHGRVGRVERLRRAIGTRDHIEVVDVVSRTVLYTIPRGDGPNIRCLAMARVAGRIVSCVSSDGWQTEVSVYADGHRQCTIPVSSRIVRGSIEVVDSQAVLIIVTVDNEISAWSLADGAYVFSVKLDQAPGAVTFGVVAGQASVALELGGRLQVRELSDSSDVRHIAGTASSIASVSFRPPCRRGGRQQGKHRDLAPQPL